MTYKIPKPVYNKLHPECGFHSVMTDWANKQAEPELNVEVVYSDGSIFSDTFERYQKDVGYMVNSERYTVPIDTKRFTRKDYGYPEPITLASLRKWFNEWVSNNLGKIEIISITWTFSDTR